VAASAGWAAGSEAAASAAADMAAAGIGETCRWQVAVNRVETCEAGLE